MSNDHMDAFWHGFTSITYLEFVILSSCNKIVFVCWNMQMAFLKQL